MSQTLRANRPSAGSRNCGPEDAARPKVRPSKMGRWRALALVLVHVLVALHVAHWMAHGTSLSPLEPSEAMEFSKHDLVNAGFVFFGLTIISTLVLGRWFCGWACHVVALQDLCLWLLKRVGIRPRPLRSRLLAWVPALAALYMFAWPLIWRVWSGIAIGPPRLELTRQDFWATFPPWPVALATFAVCGFVVVYFVGAKGFCTYACPYGALFGVADRFAVGRIRVTDACEGCAHCTATCTSNVLVHEEVRTHGMVVDPGCMKCMDCVSVCPKNALYFGFGKPSIASGARAAHRSKKGVPLGEELGRATAFVLSFLIVRGLYGVIPFLLALGLAGILSVCFTELLKLVLRARVSFLGHSLKQEGRLTRSGVRFVAAMSLVSLFCLHSGFIQFHSWRGARAFEGARDRLEEFLVDPTSRLAGEELARVEDGRASMAFVARRGLLPVRQNQLQLAWLDLLAGAPEDFERELRAVASQSSESSALHYDLARFLGARGRNEEARLELEACLTARPSASVFDQLARLLWQLGRPEEALEVSGRALAEFSDNPDLLYNRGVLLGMLGREEEAVAAFREVLELAPDRKDAHENLIGLLMELGRGEEAREVMERARAAETP